MVSAFPELASISLLFQIRESGQTTFLDYEGATMITISPFSYCCHSAKPAALLLAESLRQKGLDVTVSPSKTNCRSHLKAFKTKEFADFEEAYGTFGKDLSVLRIEQKGQIQWIPSRDWKKYLVKR